MDFNEIINYLKALGNNELVDLINRTYTTLIKYNVDEDFLQELSKIIFTDSRADDNDIIDNINNLINVIYDYLLGLVGVRLNDNVLLSTKLAIVDGLIEIEAFEDKELLVRILESDYNSSELFSEILENFTPCNSDELLSYVSDISVTFTEALRKLIKEDVPIMDASNLLTLHKTKLNNYKKYLEVTSIYNVNRFSDEYYNNILTVGLPFEVYLSVYEHSDLTFNSNEQTAIDILGMSILSKDSETEPYMSIIRKNLNKVSSNANDTSNLDTIINKLITEMNNHG